MKKNLEPLKDALEDWQILHAKWNQQNMPTSTADGAHGEQCGNLYFSER